MKTLLIPTDFNLRSLNCIPSLVHRFSPEKLNIVLVHLMKITDSMQELLMLSRRSAEYQHISPEFYDACAGLKRHHAEINSIKVEFFYGSTIAVFKNFLEAQQVDTIVMLENYSYQMLNKNSVEPAVLVNRSSLPIIHTTCAAPKLAIVKPEATLVEENV